jgi:hypothetical protein
MSYDCELGSDPSKPRCEVLHQGLHGTEVVIAVLQTIPSGHWASAHSMYEFHPYENLWVVIV